MELLINPLTPIDAYMRHKLNAFRLPLTPTSVKENQREVTRRYYAAIVIYVDVQRSIDQALPFNQRKLL